MCWLIREPKLSVELWLMQQILLCLSQFLLASMQLGKVGNQGISLKFKAQCAMYSWHEYFIITTQYDYVTTIHKT